ncbi:hypothetical protein [Streptomyces sp. MMG1121]|uniref:hypothetical protein n=1 Tax=Streptomyces sp. MMG1121 TaxID=1415544 RepID=UPI0006ADB0BA|nr:hypothetical protein [Streptomyces sp. MMG1121]KOV59301.1 hypothetical protein ADK64_34905 [Streptomyces sp. MMG1121]
MTESVAIPGDGRFQLTVTSTTQGQVFSFNIPGSDHRSVVRVTATGSTGGSTVVTYDSTTGFPDGIAAAGPLHAPVNSTGKYANLSRIDFCIKPTKYH